jgi:hypothetical protein
VIELNRLSNPGEAAARARVEELLERIDATPVGNLVPARASMPEPEERASLIADLEAEADYCGRRELLDEIRDRVRDAVHTRVNRPLVRDPYLHGPATFPMSATDLALVEMALVDAVAVAIVEDRLDPRTAWRLSLEGRMLLGMPPLGDQDAPADTETTFSEAPEAVDLLLPEPSAADWAEAAAGDTRIDGDVPPASTARVVLAFVLGCTAGPVVLLMGIVGGDVVMGVLGALAVLAVCWLIATFRR